MSYLEFFKRQLLFSVLAASVATSSLAKSVGTEESVTQLPEVIISDKSENDLRIKKDEINRVETIKAKDIQKKQAQTFAQAVNNVRGIDMQTACAFCGAKRVTINGMKGEHTTILIDGLPLHSTVSGFYGVEAIPLGGVDSIDIYRGTGAALTAPESIGGAINVVTREITTNSAEGAVSIADDGQKNISVLGARKLTPNTGLLMGLQYGEIKPIDIDNNGVSELPSQKTFTAISKLSHKINETDEVSLRLSYGKLKNIGGSMNDLELSAPPATLATSDDFVDRDVRKKYIGAENKITENVFLDRYEIASIYRKQIDQNSSLKVSLGGAHQTSHSIYSHGYDYDNDDKLWVGMVEYQKLATDNHLLTFGVDSKNQFMDSFSQTLYVDQVPPMKQDDLNYHSLGGFAQDTWFIDDANELSVVLRYDNVQTHWVDFDKKIDKGVFAPRAMYKHLHNSVLTSRLSAGVGYRSPLTLFESQHGMYHDGFVIDVDDLETAQSAVYSLAGQRLDDFFEFSAHVTRIENMAYGLDRADQDLPTLFVSSKEPYTISVVDFSYGRRITHDWTVEGLVESFHYPAGYKEKLQVAAVEQRLSVVSNVNWGKWTASQRVTVVGERDLSAYGYGDHYNVAYTDTDPLSPTFGQTFTSAQKFQKSPTFFIVDLNFERQLGENLYAGFAILNTFDYTQTGAGDSPATWHVHGDHYHLDNFHIWGPLRGRQFILSLRGNF
ncbi:TonB-dependent receptor plug domain-containing protein [Bdellovibrio sp. HCB288]|uniref:TonB-dependent receptor plug domain-containing protein n=1 Tax=Bdellovibrio sp. HCB288 TaxID=3394355 RepID=UPI0039B64E2C